MNVLLITTDADALARFDELLIDERLDGEVTAFDPERDDPIDIRPFDLIAIDSRCAPSLKRFNEKLRPANIVKPVLSLDLSRLSLERPLGIAAHDVEDAGKVFWLDN